jgi:hypothetical protein
MSIELFRIIGGEERDQIDIFSAVALDHPDCILQQMVLSYHSTLKYLYT